MCVQPCPELPPIENASIVNSLPTLLSGANLIKHASNRLKDCTFWVPVLRLSNPLNNSKHKVPESPLVQWRGWSPCVP